MALDLDRDGDRLVPAPALVGLAFTSAAGRDSIAAAAFAFRFGLTPIPISAVSSVAGDCLSNSFRFTRLTRAVSKSRLFLKLDVQGYERRVLEGARQTIPRIVGLRVELSVSRCYENEPSMFEMMDYLYALGFRLCAVDEAWSDTRTREVFQMDAVFSGARRCRCLIRAAAAQQ